MKNFEFQIQDEEGSALASVLIIIVIVSLFIGVVLSGMYVQNQFIQQDIDEVKARYAAEAGIASFLSEFRHSAITRDTPLTIPVHDNTQVTINAKPFGGFLDVESIAEVRGKEKKIRVLAGALKTDLFEYGVVLGDTSSVLMLTGSTQLKGGILTGQIGTRTTDFKGVSFSGRLEGEQTQQSGPLLPNFNTNFIQNQEELINNSFQKGLWNSFDSSYNGLGNSNAEAEDTLFFDGNVSWSSRDSISFPKDVTIAVNGNMTLNGNYYFGAFTKLLVRDTLRVGGSISGEHVLMYAGQSLQVGGGAQLSAQALSGGEIIIRDNAYLNYPSMIYTDQELSPDRQEIIIDIRDNAKVDGTVVYPVSTTNFTSGLFRVRVSDQAVVRGGIYTLGQTELEGTVLGSVLTQQFYFYESPSSYINWLKDAEIDFSGRPENYVVPLGFSEHPEYQILDWAEVQ
ncbi:pilus assembly PilX N-terminal domain-containing protein [Gracilimonas sp.]|uniref:pilus assembly PilX N-terminal domain-containing protein n=1 Tax=Gracilimonas sp. TaxID=1974203 RepID=UPI003BA86DD7